MNKLFRELICLMLERQVRALRRRYKFTVVAVAGSVGKTSTKMAVAKLLEAAGKRVQYQEGNYNDRVSVPLVFFGLTMPPLRSISAWLKVRRQMSRAISSGYNYDVVVLELGTDAPGQLKHFEYIEPDIAVITAVSPEHMEQFGSIEAVAEEELTVADFSKSILLNSADISKDFIKFPDYKSYDASGGEADYQLIERVERTLGSQSLKIKTRQEVLAVEAAYSGKQGASIVLAAVAVADMIGVPTPAIAAAVATLKPFAGRMQVLEGVNGITIIDDTYNSSPLAARAALDVLYYTEATQKIAILGDMNELGEDSVSEHQKLGGYCRSDQLSLVVTIGAQARKYLAPAAKAAGCEVVSFDRAVEAGEYVRGKVEPGGLVLVKGSQGGIFSEEAVKLLLKDPKDASRLVRQSAEWLAKKPLR
ncbi:hypothetical protein B7Y94_02750 [Candidatus Saccharibacteria bacterium 32-49-12]|nr:MAG: hypothetical protein B7Y94_02750 [Candidatus Saccharibacteria bacterium 32-49-12]